MPSLWTSSFTCGTIIRLRADFVVLFRIIQFDDFGQQQPLSLDTAFGQIGLHAFIDNAFMRGVLIDNHQTVAGLGNDVIGMHLPAGCPQRMINKLTFIGDVINALWSIHVAKENQEEQQQQRADGASGGGGEDGDGDQAKKKKQLHVPYRDSVLTKLLADSLGGNSRTVMLANISLAKSNLAESTSTLRFASRVKTIKNKPKVVVDPKDAKLKEMSAEIDRLRRALVEQAKEGAVSSSSSRDHSDHPSGGSMIVSQELFDDANERIRAMQAAHERQITDLTAKMEAEVKARDKEVERLAAEIARMKKEQFAKNLHLLNNVTPPAAPARRTHRAPPPQRQRRRHSESGRARGAPEEREGGVSEDAPTEQQPLPQRSPDRSPAAQGPRLSLRNTIAIRRHSRRDTELLRRLAESAATEVARGGGGGGGGGGDTAVERSDDIARGDSPGKSTVL